MADVQFPELARVGTSYELVRPDLGLTIHITEPLITVPETRGKTTIWTIASKFAAMLDRDPSLVEAVNIMMTPLSLSLQLQLTLLW